MDILTLNKMKVQSVLVPRNKFSLGKAKEWVHSHNYRVHKVDVTSNYFRFRQVNPSSLSDYHMKNLPDGVKLVLGS